MCEPTTMMLGLSIASAGFQYISASQQADAMRSSQEASYNAQMQQMQLQRQQINEQASDQMSARAMQAQAAESRLRASAGESGLSGVSEDRNEAEVKFNESQDIATIDKNRRAQIAQAGANASGIQAQTQSAINSVRQPSLIGAGLQVAGTYANIKARQPNVPKAGIDSGYYDP